MLTETPVPGKPTTIVRVRILSQMPPGEFEGQKTVSGLQSRNQALLPGISAGRDLLEFMIGLVLARSPRTGAPRFQGIFVHDGPQSQQHLHLGWRYSHPRTDDPWIVRVKIPLAITRVQLDGAIAVGGLLEVDATGLDWDTLRNSRNPQVSANWVLRGPPNPTRKFA